MLCIACAALAFQQQTRLAACAVICVPFDWFLQITPADYARNTRNNKVKGSGACSRYQMT